MNRRSRHRCLLSRMEWQSHRLAAPKNKAWDAHTFDLVDLSGNTPFVMGPVTSDHYTSKLLSNFLDVLRLFELVLQTLADRKHYGAAKQNSVATPCHPLCQIGSLSYCSRLPARPCTSIARYFAALRRRQCRPLRHPATRRAHQRARVPNRHPPIGRRA